jgi:quinol monooxygenase YgiN
MKQSSTSRCAAPLLIATALLAPTACANAGQITYPHIPAGALSIVAEVRAKPGKEDELRAVTLPLIQAVRSEPNNIVYFLQENRSSPGHFIFYEVFASEADFEAHNATPHVQAWFKKLPDLAQGGVQVMKMQVLQSPQVGR